MRKKFTPRKYQGLMTDYISNNKRCALWAEMGLGKSVATLNAIDEACLMGYDRPTLVLAPLLVASTTWPEESRKWDHLRHIRVVPIVGTEHNRVKALRLDASVFTTNYEQIPWLVEHFGAQWPFERVIADESTRLKGFRTRQGGIRAQALAKVAHSKIKFFTELTGTPSPNGLLDLWGQMWMIDAGVRLGRTFTAFKQRWFIEDRETFTIKPLPHAEQEIKTLLQDVCLTVQAKDWFDLKAPIVNNKYVELPSRARNLYKEMEDKFFFELDQHQVEAVNSAARSQKLLQLANGAVYVDPLTEDDSDPRSKMFKEVHDEKLQMLESIVAESSGKPILVAYNFKSDLARILKAFPRAVALTPRNVSSTMKDWNAGKIQMLLAHPQSAGHGLNLQDGGNILVFFGVNWNLEHRMQIVERIGPTRQLQAGHDRPVFIYNILTKGTIDELVMARIESKREIQELLLEAMKRRN